MEHREQGKIQKRNLPIMKAVTIKRLREVVDIIEPPDDYELTQHNLFRKGQEDRKNGKPCMSDNGQYIDGWYNPDKKAYYITEDQANVFQL